MPDVDDSGRPPSPRDITGRVRHWLATRPPSIGVTQLSPGQPAAATHAARRKLARAASTTSAALSWASVGGIAAMAVLAATSSTRTHSTQPATRTATLTPAATKPSAPSAHSSTSQPAIRVAAVRQSATSTAKSDASPVTGTPAPAAPASSPAPASETTSPAPVEPPAPLTRWSEGETAAALRECLTLLAPIAAGLDVSEPMRAGDCGSPAPVLLRSVGSASRIEMKPAATLNCRMVAKLHDWVETTLQPAARAELGSPVVRIIGSSGYSCRNRYGLANAPISEHAFANAIDIGGFVLADGRTVSVLGAWGPTARDTTKDKDGAKIAKTGKPAVTELRTKVAAAAEAASHPPAPPTVDNGKPASPERPSVSQRVASLATKPMPGRSALGNPPPSPADAARAASDLTGPAPSPAASATDDTATTNAGAKGASETKNSPKTKDAEAASKKAKETAVQDAREKERDAEKARLAEAQSRFLKRLHSGACRTFATVLGPEANEAHRNHFHFDLKERRSKVAVCQ